MSTVGALVLTFLMRDQLTAIVFGVTHDWIMFPAAGPPSALSGFAGCADTMGRASANNEKRQCMMKLPINRILANEQRTWPN